MQPAAQDFSVFKDEEEVLQFNVFVAELELIVGSSRDRKPDNIALLELLQKLVVSIGTTDRAVLKANQKRCEAVLLHVLCTGAAASVSTSSAPLCVPPRAHGARPASGPQLHTPNAVQRHGLVAAQSSSEPSPSACHAGARCRDPQSALRPPTLPPHVRTRMGIPAVTPPRCVS